VTNHAAPGTAFDQRDTLVLKAIGIIAIVLHNYFHLLWAAVRENEFDFDPERVRAFVAVADEPTRAIQASFSYLGHYGVLLFIFLSAYGLAVRYWQPSSYSGFLWGRIRKIYPTWFVVLGLYLLLQLGEGHPGGLATLLHKHGAELVFTTLGVATLVPGYDFEPVGPWWFLPFILQFYAIWPALAAFTRRFGGIGLVILSVIGTGLWAEFPVTLEKFPAVRLMFTPLGHLPEISLGIACARLGARVGKWSALAAAAFFLLGNVYRWFWPVSLVSALVLMLYTYQQTSGRLRASRLLLWVGGISMPLFFVNGFLRAPFWELADSGAWYAELGGGICFAVFSAAVAYAIGRIAQRLPHLRVSSRPSPWPRR
jgi:peptidoglycan/LPS O-acetylase OafA/YrhL